MRGMKGPEAGVEAGGVGGGTIPDGGEAVTTDENSCSCQCLMSDPRLSLDYYKADERQREEERRTMESLNLAR